MAVIQDVIQDVHRRLVQAPLLSKVKASRARLETAMQAVAAAEEGLRKAAEAAGAVVGEGFRHRDLLVQRQSLHRKGVPAALLLSKVFESQAPAHLLHSFTTDRHVAIKCDQTQAWEKWMPPEQPLGLVHPQHSGFLLRWGGFDETSRTPFSAWPLIGAGKPWLIISDTSTDAHARELMRALVLRLACTLPQQSRFTLLDPLHYGQTFPMQRYLPAVRESSGDLARDLQPIQMDVRRIIRDVVAFHESFEALPAEQQSAERYEFILASDFPRAKAYDRRVADMLFDIGRAGPKAGRYLILHVTADAELPHGADYDQLGECIQIDLRNNGFRDRADKAPSAQMQQALLERARSAAPVRRSADFGEVLPPRAQWWEERATQRIQTTLDGRKDGLEITFGQRKDGTELVHGVLAAAAGAGKSNLLHTLLLGLATRYPPEELNLYLMDLKQGVEFQPYAALPHAAVVAYNTDPALARAVISEMRREMQRRYEDLFRRAGVQKLEDYRNAGQPHGHTPRVLLVIDEYHALFQNADAQEVSADLLALSTQGRAAGIHMLLGSQTFRAVGMQGSEQIFNNINIRMAMSMPSAVVQAMTEFDRMGKEMIRSCDAPGKVVLNTSAGRDGNGANQLGQVVLVSAQDRSRVLDELDSLAQTWPAEQRMHWPQTQVFDGSRAPSLAGHGLTRVLAREGRPLDAKALASWATSAKRAGGLERGDWRIADGPIPLLLGREFAVHGEAAVLLRRLPNQNLLVLGGSAQARLGMLDGVVASALALAPDVLASVRVIDFSGDDAMRTALAAGGARIVTIEPSQAVEAINAPSETGPDLLLLIEPDRSLDLLRPSDPLARSPGVDALEKRLREGPLSGRHTVLVCNAWSAINRVLGRRGAQTFAWRAVTQISQEDSQDLLGNRMGSQLRDEDRAGPEAALLADVDGNRFTRFMPYGT